ncbi:transposase-like protein [Colletotrichum musicola]|uniref:Transposase-like protein n=1 Tax=Colletotrichum musicola TaxID=2175873 RepID=A0A8H6J1Y6_9PEZI|nr:transposase-like protein [Colletotrichum musicola]
MIDRALKKQTEIQTFLARNVDEVNPHRCIPIEDHLTIEDWRLLIELKHAFFGDPEIPAQSQSRKSNRRKGRRAEAPIRLSPSSLPPHVRSEYINKSYLNRFEALDADSQQYFRVSVVNGWKKLNQYYKTLEESPLYASAVILHPGMGFRWLEAIWTSGEQLIWLGDAKQQLYEYWARWYRDGGDGSRPSTPPDDSAVEPPLVSVLHALQMYRFFDLLPEVSEVLHSSAF